MSKTDLIERYMNKKVLTGDSWEYRRKSLETQTDARARDGDKEALTISTTGDPSWTDYSFLVDLKFDTGPSNKPDRGALLVYRYTSGNDYYFLALREARDELEVYMHGTGGGGGHLRATASCTLVPGTWYSVNITIRGDNVWASIDDIYCFSNLAMDGSHSQGSVGIGTEYYKVMFDNIIVELRN